MFDWSRSGGSVALGPQFIESSGNVYCTDHESKSVSRSDAVSGLWSSAGRWSDSDFGDVDAERHLQV